MFKLWLKSVTLFLRYEPKTWILFVRMVYDMGLPDAFNAYFMAVVKKVEREVNSIYENEEAMVHLMKFLEFLEEGDIVGGYREFMRYMLVAVEHTSGNYKHFLEDLHNARVKSKLNVVA